MTNEMKQKLLNASKEMAGLAKPHISKFHVGAALLCKNGEVYGGCNIEFDNFTNTIHAEMAAITNLVVCGRAFSEVTAIAVFTKTRDFPCGLCRQSLFEKFGGELLVIATDGEKIKELTMNELLPFGFKL